MDLLVLRRDVYSLISHIVALQISMKDRRVLVICKRGFDPVQRYWKFQGSSTYTEISHVISRIS